MKSIHPEMRDDECYLDYFAVKEDFFKYLNEMPDSYVEQLCTIFAFLGNKNSNPLMRMVEHTSDHYGITNWKSDDENYS
jgi:hypothetical protein